MCKRITSVLLTCAGSHTIELNGLKQHYYLVFSAFDGLDRAVFLGIVHVVVVQWQREFSEVTIDAGGKGACGRAAS